MPVPNPNLLQDYIVWKEAICDGDCLDGCEWELALL